MHTKNLSAFILAAGLGERLRPITDSIPKPLLPLIGKTVLQSVLEKISVLQIGKIGMNLHYKKESILHWVRQSPYENSVALFPEDPILGTGGALKNAETFLQGSTFLVHNADIVSDIDLGNLIDSHLSSGNLATLAIHNYPEFNKLEVNDSGLLTGLISCRKWTKGGWRPAAFTGIAVYQPEFLRFLPEGVSSVVDAWFNAIAAGYKVGTFDVTGCSWNDIGTLVSYARTVIGELRRNGETVFIHPSVKGCSGIEMNGYLVIEKNNTIPEGISLRNCIVLPETNIKKQGRDDGDPQCFLTLFWGVNKSDPIKTEPFENCILGPGFRIDLNESKMLGADAEEDDRILIGVGGSDRQYFRMQRDSRTVIFMQCRKDDPDFERHIEYSRFFQKFSVPVPNLIEADFQSKTAVFEDLGDISLYSWLKCPREDDEVETIYRRVLDILVSIHSEATAHIAECPLLESRLFDYAYLRWETDYFAENFLQRVCKIPVDVISRLSDEFHRLATTVNSFRKTIIHRDFQSQNIMVTTGFIPRILDYQGARMAPPAYDVVSILWDPYYRLNEVLRVQLVDYYTHKMKERSVSFSKNEFVNTVLPCRLQRHMQALGAYSFLSRNKGKKYFLKHISEGLRLLKEDVALSENTYPELNKVVIALKEIV
jgi:NDP-sugar pyrophosphorylase family protein/aminoglycoside/choline kinase family phosphotransferase